MVALMTAVVALLGVAAARAEGGDIDKRDLEFNQYVPGYRLRGEPSCEELREMWRLSKREARRATSTNQLPRRSHHTTYGRLVPFAPEAPPRTPPVYGSTWIYPPQGHVQARPFDTLKSLLGPGDRRNRYDKLRKIMAAERGPGQSSKGSLDQLLSLVSATGTRKLQNTRPLALALRAHPGPQPRAPPPLPRHQQQQPPPPPPPPPPPARTLSYSQQSFLGPLLPADAPTITKFSPWHPSAPDPPKRSCEETKYSYCRVNSDCACAGLYRCNKGRCKVSSKQPVAEDSMGAWYSGPLEAKDLGVWNKR